MRKLTMLLFSLLAFVGVVRAQVETILPEGVEESAFGTNAVTDGTNFYATLQAAVEAVAGKANSTLYCKPCADVGSLQHAPVTATLTVYGNGAYVSGGSDRDFDLGNTDPNLGKDITADMTLTVKNLDGCGAWGTKATEHTVNVVFENCKNMYKVFINGTTGTLNISMTDCAFEGAFKDALYSNADGNITLTNVAFSNLNKAVNLNHKATGTQTVTINGCSFTNCGADVAADQIPVRVVSSVEGGKSVLSVSNSTFSGTPAGGADVLLDYGVGVTEAAVENTSANVHYEQENNVPVKETVSAGNSYEFTTAKPVAKIGDTPYYSFAEAVAAADADETIVLLSNVECAEKPVFTKGGVVNVDVNGFVFESNDYNRVRNVASADGTVESNNIKFVNGFGWEVYNANGSTSVAGTNFHVFPTLSEAVSYKPSERDLAARIYPYQENIKLDADVTLRATAQGTASTICVDPGYTVNLDLNGYTVLQESPTGNPLEACVRGKLTLDDTSDAKTGKWIAGACGVTDPSNTTWYGNGGPAFYVLGNGCVTLKGGEVSIARNNGVDVVNTGGLIRLDGGSVVVDGATLNVDDTYGIMAWGGSVTVNSGDFVMGTNGIYSVFAMKYYADASVEVNSAIDGYLLVHESVSAVVNVAGVKYYADGNDYVAPSVGEGLVAQGGVVGRPVAKIGDVEYATLAAAVEAAQNDETIILIADVELTAQVEIPAGKELTLDLNGKTVTVVYQEGSTTKHIYSLDNYGTLTIKDTKGNGSINSRGIFVQDGSKLTVESGSLYGIDSNGGSALYQYGGDIVINGGHIEQKAEGTYNFAINALGGTVTVNGGKIAGNHGAIAAGGATVVINGGELVCTGTAGLTDNVLYTYDTGAITINGGIFVADNDGPAGGCCVYDANGKATINGGTFSNSSGGDVWGTTGTTIKGGTFENLTETQHIAEGYEMNENGEVVEAVKEVKVATLAELQAALADNSSELPIIITETIVIPEGETVVLDLNGKTVTRQDEANQYALRNLGDLTIKDTKGNGSINARGIYNGYGDGGANVATAKITVVSGTINTKGTNGGGAAIFNYGVADIQGGTFTSVASYAIALQTGSTMTIGENAIITGGINSWQSTLTITGGTISNDKSGKHVVYAGESAVTINGGTFHNNNSGNATIMASGSPAAVEITGGTFTLNIVDASSSYLIDATSSATYTISGGSFTGGIRAQGGTKYEITGGTFTNEYGNYNVYEGGDINISGGTFTGSYAQKFATDNIAAGYELGANGTVAAKPVAEVNGVKYATFAEAVAAAHKATDKVTITLKKDITVAKSISINKLVTIDLNGKAISSAEGYVFEVTGGELVLQGEGSIGAICYIINDADYKAADKTFALTENKNNVDIVYNRTFGHTSWQVLYVPFAIPVENMEGFEVYSISDVTDSGVVIEQVVEDELSANTPYIIKATEAGDKTIKVTGATLSVPVAYEETIGNFTINGTYSSMAIDAESQYVLTNGLWCQLSDEAVENGNNILGAFRVYLTANGENNPSEVRFVINNSDATAIDELKAENGNVKAEVYDLSGRRVEKAVKGIYVVNGVKVIK